MFSQQRFDKSVLQLTLAMLILVTHTSLHAQSRFSKGGGAAAQAQQDAGSEDEPIAPSGLRAVYPAQARCPEIVSAFGAQTRYDGSMRPKNAFGGYHGGIDITLAEGTPLLALAAGTVVSKGAGGALEGNYLWLRHAPADTNLAYWIYSKYQHLETIPDLEVGQKLAAGQQVARSGKTGTMGKHYGAAGYAHLHLTTRKSTVGDESVVLRGTGGNSVLFDPLAIFHEAARPRDAGRPLDANSVIIPYVFPDGSLTPSGTRVVWPVACPAA
jgi:murein DD-endopeptidase MepM/ murein hydrolase activator NlpD